MITYDPFWKTLNEKKMNTYELVTFYRVSGNTIQKLRDNENLTIKTLERLCKILRCKIENIVEVRL